MKKFALLAIFLALPIVGCSTWERTTFNTLAASQAVVNTAQTDYESGQIPKTQCAYALINDAKAADTAAVNGMVVYEQLKATSGDVTAQEAIVVTDLASLAPLVIQIQQLTSNPTTVCK